MVTTAIRLKFQCNSAALQSSTTSDESDSLPNPTLPYVLRPPVGPVQTSTACSNALVLIHLELGNIFQTVFFASQREHWIIDWCRVLLHKEGT